jgi:hypothetical protein
MGSRQSIITLWGGQETKRWKELGNGVMIIEQ